MQKFSVTNWENSDWCFKCTVLEIIESVHRRCESQLHCTLTGLPQMRHAMCTEQLVLLLQGKSPTPAINPWCGRKCPLHETAQEALQCFSVACGRHVRIPDSCCIRKIQNEHDTSINLFCYQWLRALVLRIQIGNRASIDILVCRNSLKKARMRRGV